MISRTQCATLAMLALMALPLAAQETKKLTPEQVLLAYRKSNIEEQMDDWGDLNRYRAANAALKPAAKNEDRVVFLGDSITDGWPLKESFPGRPYLNRGISGQTTSQMLLRFRQDVIQLQPKVVVILAGTNDIAGNTGPMSLEDIESNYATMAELAQAHGIRVVFSAVTPIHNYTPESEMFFPLRPMAKILELNRWLKRYCEDHHCLYLDYFNALVDENGFLKRELAADGLHPNAAGYKIMAALAEVSIQKALKP